MSHFTVLVVGDDVEKALAPFHEFECTGQDDEYVQTLDVTEEVRSEFLEHELSLVQAPDGTLHDWSDPMFFRDPTPEELTKGSLMGSGAGDGIHWHSQDWGDGLGYRPKIHHLPNGYQNVKVLAGLRMSFREYVEDYDGTHLVSYGEQPDLAGLHKYGYATLTADGEIDGVFRRTNPNRKWDWYQEGGRWAGSLLLKDGSRVDSALVEDLDFEGQRQQARADAASYYDRFQRITAGLDYRPFDSFEGEINVRRKEYWAQPFLTKLRLDKSHDFFFLDEETIAALLGPRETYLDAAERRALSFFAYLKDGEWRERGKMRMFGMVEDEKDGRDWDTEFVTMLEALPAGTRVTVVDCHI